MAPRSSRWLPPLLVVLLTVVAFLPSRQGEFLNWDDDANYLANEHYRGLGAANLRWMFTDFFGHYMPLTWLTLGLDYLLWGMNPVGYHATSILLHAVTALLVFLFLRDLIRRARPDLPEMPVSWIAAAGALFFSIHPLRVESVAWITERRDVTSGIFYLLTLITYLKMTSRPSGSSARRKWLWISVACFVGMILSKAMAMTLPLVLLLLDLYPLRRRPAETLAALLREKIPFFVLMIGAIAATSITQSHAEALYTREGYPLIQSLTQPGFRVAFYLLKTLLPVDLSPLYWYRPTIGIPQVLGWLAVLGISTLAFLRRRSAPAAGIAWASYLVLIAPVSGVFQAGPHFAADRYSYFACLPFAALFAAALLSIPPRTALGIAGGILLTLGALTWRQCGFWTDSFALWNRAIALDPDVYFTHCRRGQALAARGQWVPALEDYNRSIELNPAWFESRGARARARLHLQDLAGAIDDATQALRLQPGWGEGFNLRAQALSKMGRPQEAIADFSRALEIRPQYMEARIGRATDRARLGDLDGAIADLDEAIRFDPQPAIYVRRGMTRAMREDLAGAATDFARALELAPPDWPQRRQVQEFLDRARGPK